VLLVIPAMLAVYEQMADKFLPKRTQTVTI